MTLFFFLSFSVGRSLSPSLSMYGRRRTVSRIILHTHFTVYNRERVRECRNESKRESLAGLNYSGRAINFICDSSFIHLRHFLYSFGVVLSVCLCLCLCVSREFNTIVRWRTALGLFQRKGETRQKWMRKLQRKLFLYYAVPYLYLYIKIL